MIIPSRKVHTDETCTRGVVERLLNSRIPTSPISSRSVIVAMENNETTSTTHDSHGVTNGRLAKDVEEIKIPVPWGHVSGQPIVPRLFKFSGVFGEYAISTISVRLSLLLIQCRTRMD
ncbi:hypothetical protein X777_01907 [Ooceraea biroi]|uniref:Uncharacterized protein n=1 Tax=Ooceraea biroi TaxID=2015173 RepID=A0A026VT01_OOCBI|nr:hypothetical protein X777_01907 [Ooceraea biroi]